MLNESVGPFIINPTSTLYIKHLETTYEVKEPLTNRLIDSSFIIAWSKFYRLYRPVQKDTKEVLSSLRQLSLLYKTNIEDQFVSFQTNLTIDYVFPKAVEVINIPLRDQLIMNNKLPQGFSELVGETTLEGKPLPFTRVHLLSGRYGTKLSSTSSDKDGIYKFEGVRKGSPYITVAVDPLKEYTTVSQDISV